MNSNSQTTPTATPVTYGWIKTPFRVELMHARFSNQQFAPHAHEDWALCAVIAGKKNIAIPSREEQLAQAGDVYLLHPEQAHAGGSVDDQPCEYVMLYISDEEWQQQAARRGVTAHRTGLAPFAHALLSQHISAFVLEVLAHPRESRDWSEAWTRLLDILFEEKGIASGMAPDLRVDNRVGKARDYLRSHWQHPVSLDMLGNLSALSKFELTRRFCAVYGLPPHRYQMTLRITQAKDQLLNGQSLSDVATATGFADQSHLGRVFKSVVGMTPGAFSNQTWLLYAGTRNGGYVRKAT